MNRFIMILMFHFPVLVLSGQEDFCNFCVDQRSLFEASLTGQIYQMKATIGSQIFMNGTFPGDIILVSGDTVRNKQISYNGYHDELIWTGSVNNNMIKVDKEQVGKFILHINNFGTTVAFRHLNGTTENRKIDFFAQILVEDSLSLFATRNSHRIEKSEQGNEDFTTYIDRIEPIVPVYYIGLPHNKFLSFKQIRKKSLYDTFPAYKEEIKTLLNQHHQALRNESDLIHVMQLLNKYSIIRLTEKTDSQ